jgi:hypothetical protein
MTMSMIDTLGRAGAALRSARTRSKAVRMLNSLPPDIQKDIGWPVSQRVGEKQALFSAIWSAAR